MEEITLENILNVLLQFKEETNYRFNEIDSHFTKSDNRLTSLENIVTKMEHEHGEKLAFLCDNVKINNEKHEEFEQVLNKINSKIYDHDIRIEILEENFQKAL